MLCHISFRINYWSVIILYVLEIFVNQCHLVKRCLENPLFMGFSVFFIDYFVKILVTPLKFKKGCNQKTHKVNT